MLETHLAAYRIIRKESVAKDREIYDYFSFDIHKEIQSVSFAHLFRRAEK